MNHLPEITWQTKNVVCRDQSIFDSMVLHLDSRCKIIGLNDKVFFLRQQQLFVYQEPVISKLLALIENSLLLGKKINTLLADYSETHLLYFLDDLINKQLLSKKVSNTQKLNRNNKTDYNKVKKHYKKLLGSEIPLHILYDQGLIAYDDEHRFTGTYNTKVLLFPFGKRPWISTVLTNGNGPCVKCVLYWLRHNRPVETFLAHQHPATLIQAAHYNWAEPSLLNGLFQHLNKEHKAPSSAYLIAWNPVTMLFEKHRLIRRPQCSCCGDPNWMQTQAKQPLSLNTNSTLNTVSYDDGMGVRIIDSNTRFKRSAPLISTLCGPIAYIQKMPHRHQGARYAYVSGYLSCPQQWSTAQAFNRVCAGKGHTDIQAKTSALCEAIERLSAVYQGDEYQHCANQIELEQPSIGFDQLQHFSQHQFQQRKIINQQSQDPRKQVPLPFDAHQKMQWTSAWSLTKQCACWVPLTYCFNNTPHLSDSQYGIYNPNGSAAGNNVEEAVLQGLLELIERDAVAIWWYNQLIKCAVDLDSFNKPYWKTLITEYEQQGYRVEVLDLSTDIAIPCFAAIAQHQKKTYCAIGFGCHPQADTAINRALTELNQLFDPNQAITPWDDTLIHDKRFLKAKTHTPLRCNNDYQTTKTTQLSKTLQTCIKKVKQQGLDILVVNKTRPDLDLSVVQVIVPELRHFWPRFGPGRLYDIPVKMQALTKAKTEQELNPAPLFL